MAELYPDLFLGSCTRMLCNDKQMRNSQLVTTNKLKIQQLQMPEAA